MYVGAAMGAGAAIGVGTAIGVGVGTSASCVALAAFRLVAFTPAPVTPFCADDEVGCTS